MTTQADFLLDYVATPLICVATSSMRIISKLGRAKRGKALAKIFSDLLASHRIPCKGDGYDTIGELQEKLSNKSTAIHDEVPIVINIISNNIYHRAYNIAASESKKRSKSIKKSIMHAFSEKEKNRFLEEIKQPRIWEVHKIASFVYPQYYFLPKEEELEYLFHLFSDNEIQKRWIDIQK